MVVGASAAGLQTAAILARRGTPVTVHERGAGLTAVDRSLIVTHKIRDELGPLVEPAIVNTISRYELVADGVVASLELGAPDIVVERTALIRTLAEHATAGGVDVRFGSRFEGFDRTHDRTVVRFTGRTGDVTDDASIVVGADGVHSGVARSAGWRPAATAPLVQARVRRPDDLDPDTTRVWFRPDETPYFYWLIPDGPEHAVLGLIAEAPETARRHLDAFLATHRLEPLVYQAARIPIDDGWRRPYRTLGSATVCLVGDAAGHVKVTTVGGLQTGFRGARAIAQLLLDDDRTELRGLRRELGRHRAVRAVLHRFDEDDYRRLLRVIGPRTRPLLARYSRDESGSLLWRLGVGDPRLLLLALRGALTRPGQGSSAGTRSNNAARKAPSTTSQPISR